MVIKFSNTLFVLLLFLKMSAQYKTDSAAIVQLLKQDYSTMQTGTLKNMQPTAPKTIYSLKMEKYGTCQQK